MTELTPDQQRNLDATVAAVQRVAMHIVTLPKKQRAEQYAAVRRTFEESIQKFGVEGETAHKSLDTMDLLRALVSEIEAGGGAGGGKGVAEKSHDEEEPCALADKQVRPARNDDSSTADRDYSMFSVCYAAESDDWE